MMKYKDFTLKARLYDKDGIHEKLTQLGFKYEGEDYQQDYYFKTPKGKLKYRKGNNSTLIAHYERVQLNNIEKTVVYRYEVNPSELQIQYLFSSKVLLVKHKKNRKLYLSKNVSIHIDELSKEEIYIEIEAKDFNENYTELELQNQCKSIFNELGIIKSNLIKTGYI